ncbi:MsnO8 family LLM class oxidoreductase [Undibacterium sp. TS12]|uniref:MsnO8 family LLM class oxidoreductase n=1 Tax=Undibacterium sp. TS12 TaxID=2908202 RepID=UPI001F4CA083|nr:MsnO8 family LLM class oxidoreductase [Undibacterium sp. TS12]MCH8621035.1 LLM class flavin-dependent oxidoreductase [Undibacterium sp. TS12]
MSELTLSLLDLGIIAPGQDGKEVLAQTFRMAQLADQLGYERLWLAEHHESHFSWAAPEMMLAAIARATQRIGLGSAAVLLPLYSPLAVAENYRGLSALSGGRVVLGVCGGVPADPVALAALTGNDDAPAIITRQFADKLAALVKYLHGDFPDDHRFTHAATPCFAAAPPLWVMGSGFGTAELAARSAASYAYSLFHRASTQDAAITAAYRRQFAQYQQDSNAARIAVALSCVCADSEEVAQTQKQQVESWIGNTMRVNICGTPTSCRDQILAIQETYDADSIIIYHMWHLEERKRAAITTLAELFQLAAMPS